MPVSAVLDSAGRRRAPAALPGFHSGRVPRTCRAVTASPQTRTVSRVNYATAPVSAQLRRNASVPATSSGRE